MLSQSCATLRNILQGYNAREFARSSANDRIGYFARRARDLPDHWVCEKCATLHRVEQHDCPWHPNGCTADGFLEQPTFFDYGRYHLEHRHIQLILKYTRMGDSCGPLYRMRLQYMMRGCLWDSTAYRGPHLYWGRLYPGTGAFWAEPKVADGRFLLSTGAIFYPDEPGPLHRDHTCMLMLCGHQVWCPSLAQRLDRVRAPGSAVPPDEAAVLESASWVEDSELHRAMAHLLETKGTEANVSCPFCPSEAQVTISRDKNDRQKIQASFWHDFGTEGSPLDVQWKAMQFPAIFCDRTIHYPHPPGSIRQLWERSREE